MSNAGYQLVIVGCGPVGALAANLAGAAGLRTLVIDREHGAWPLPRAAHLDHEMMRLFQSVGLADSLRANMTDADGHLHVGADGGVIRYLGTAGRPQPFGWAGDYFFYQPELDRGLRDGFARFANVTAWHGAVLDDLRQDDNGVVLSVTMDGTSHSLRADHVIGCDGARSTVRRLLGATLQDLDFDEPWLVVDVEVDGPVRFPPIPGLDAAADLQRLSVMMCDPARPATVVPGRGTLRRWEFMLLPGEDEAAMMRPDRVAALLAPWLGDTPHRMVRAATYRFHGLLADRWQDRAVFLAGDAAHQTPPFFGQGMCHGMRDVANLVWKIAAVAGGHAAPALLDSYQPERAPQVRAVVAAAVAAGTYICELDPARAAARDAAMRAAARAATRPPAQLIPPLHAGIIAADTQAAGERFIQPLLADGRLLDAATDPAGSPGWRLFTRGAASTSLAAAAVAVAPVPIAVHDIDTLPDDGTLAGWFTARGVAAVLVRPDFYVYGTAVTDAAELPRRLAQAWPHPAPARVRQKEFE